MGPLRGASKSLKKQSIWSSRVRNKVYVYVTYHSQAVLSIVGTNYSVGLKRAFGKCCTSKQAFSNSSPHAFVEIIALAAGIHEFRFNGLENLT